MKAVITFSVIAAFFVLLSITIKTLKRESKLERAEGGNI